MNHAYRRLILFVVIAVAGSARAGGEVITRMGPWGGPFIIDPRWVAQQKEGCADKMWHFLIPGKANEFPYGGYGFNELRPAAPLPPDYLPRATMPAFEEQLERLSKAFRNHGYAFEPIGMVKTHADIERLAARLPAGSKLGVYGRVGCESQAFWMGGMLGEDGRVLMEGSELATQRFASALEQGGKRVSLELWHARPLAAAEGAAGLAAHNVARAVAPSPTELFIYAAALGLVGINESWIRAQNAERLDGVRRFETNEKIAEMTYGRRPMVMLPTPSALDHIVLPAGFATQGWITSYRSAVNLGRVDAARKQLATLYAAAEATRGTDPAAARTYAAFELWFHRNRMRRARPLPQPSFRPTLPRSDELYIPNY